MEGAGEREIERKARPLSWRMEGGFYPLSGRTHAPDVEEDNMIRKLASGEYRLYSRKRDAKTGRRRNLGTFKTRRAAQQHEREVQFFKRH